MTFFRKKNMCLFVFKERKKKKYFSLVFLRKRRDTYMRERQKVFLFNNSNF